MAQAGNTHDPFEEVLRRRLAAGEPHAASAQCADAAVLAAYHERALAASERAHWDAHFADCARCRAALAAMVRGDAERTPASAGGRSASPWLSWRGAGLAAGSAIAAAAAIMIAVMRHGPAIQIVKREQAMPSGVADKLALNQNAPRSEAGWLASTTPSAQSEKKYEAAKPPPLAEHREHHAEHREARVRERDQEFAKNVERQARLKAPAEDAAGNNAVEAEGESTPSATSALAARESASAAPASPAAAPALATASGEMQILRGGTTALVPPAASASAPLVSASPAAASTIAAAVGAPSTGAQVAKAAPSGNAGAGAAIGGGVGAIAGAGTGAIVGTAVGHPSTDQSLASLQKAMPGANAIVVEPPDFSAVWMIGEHGAISHYDRGGGWTAQPSGVGADLTAGSAPSVKVCWVVGRGGTIVRTVDGTHWEKLTSPVGGDLTGVTAADANYATITAADGNRYATSDGGHNWHPL